MSLRAQRAPHPRGNDGASSLSAPGRDGSSHLFTLESVLYLSLLILGLVLRLLLVDERPLTVNEGTLALESYLIFQGRPPEGLLQGPLLAYGSALTQAMFAGGDGAARLLSVIFGTLLVGAPYLLRHSLGRTAALLSSAAIALSPLFLFASRYLGSGIVPLALGLTLWGTLQPGPKVVGSRRFGVAVLMLAGLLASGREGITVLVTMILAAGLAHPHPREQLGRWRVALSRGNWQLPAAVLVGGLAILGTGFGTNFATLQAALVDNWAQWFTSFSFSAARGGPVALLLMYELPIVLLGMVQLLRTLLRRDFTDAFLSLWTMLLLLIGMVQTGDILPRVLLPLLPLYLLAARLVADTAGAATWRESGWRWVVSSVAVVVPMAVALVLLNRASTPGMEIPSPFIYGELALIGVAMVSVGALLSARSRLALGWYVLVFSSAAFLLHGTVFLNYRLESLPAEPVLGSQISTYLRDASRDAAYFSTYFYTPVTVDPSLRQATAWYLRDARAVQFSNDANQGIVIKVPQSNQPDPAAGLERRPGVYQPALERADLSWRSAWRWLVDRGGLVRSNQRDIIVRTPSGNW